MPSHRGPEKHPHSILASRCTAVPGPLSHKDCQKQKQHAAGYSSALKKDMGADVDDEVAGVNTPSGAFGEFHHSNVVPHAGSSD